MRVTAAAVTASTPQSLQTLDLHYAPYLIHASPDFLLNQSSVCSISMFMPAQTRSVDFKKKTKTKLEGVLHSLLGSEGGMLAVFSQQQNS